MKKYLVINPVKLFRILTNKDISTTEKLKYSLLLSFIVLFLVVNDRYYNSPEQIKEREITYLKNEEERKKSRIKDSLRKIEERELILQKCSSESSVDNYLWKRRGADYVKDTWSVISLSLSLGEIRFSSHQLPERVEDIDCGWTEDFYHSQSLYLRRTGVANLMYPEKKESLECFCLGFEQEAKKYILNN